MRPLLLSLVIGSLFASPAHADDAKTKAIEAAKAACETAPNVIPKGYHAHRKIDGSIVIHSDSHAGDYKAHEGIAWPWKIIARAGQPVPKSSKK